MAHVLIAEKIAAPCGRGHHIVLRCECGLIYTAFTLHDFRRLSISTRQMTLHRIREQHFVHLTIATSGGCWTNEPPGVGGKVKAPGLLMNGTTPRSAGF